MNVYMLFLLNSLSLPQPIYRDVILWYDVIFLFFFFLSRFFLVINNFEDTYKLYY